MFDIPASQIKAISKLYQNIYDKLDIKNVVYIENFLNKLAEKVQSITTKEALAALSKTKSVNKRLLNDLLTHCKNKNQIKFMYNSPKSGYKEIELIADKLSFKSDKLYLWGQNLTHKEYSYFLVDRIIEISEIKLIKSNEEYAALNIIYEIYNSDEYILDSNEKIISRDKNKIVIEHKLINEFSFLQKILYMTSECKILEPCELRDKFINKLKLMESIYE